MNTKNKITAILLSFLGLWITSVIPREFEIFIGFLLIFTFGILHGSNDMLLINSSIKSKKNYSFVKALTIYILSVLISLLAFYITPVFTLFLFICFSAYHFGEQHWEKKLDFKKKYLKSIFYFSYGLLILILLFFLNKSETSKIIFSITQYFIQEKMFTYALVLSFALLLLVMFFNYNTFLSLKKQLLFEVFIIAVLGVIFKVSTLIWGFTIYFIFWHSLPSLYEQIEFVYGNYNIKNFKSYLKKALPYWIISVIGIAIIYYYFNIEKLFYAVLFSFIAAVTFPHTLVISNMFKQKNTIK